MTQKEKDIKKQKIIINLKKTQSLISKIIKMMEQERYCIDIIQQNLAAIGMLKSVHHQLLEKHLTTCFLNACESKQQKTKQKMIEELLKLNKLFTK